MSNAKLTLVSHHLCPYVQRAAIALTEKGVPFERRYVDLSAKPDWFLAISPLGKAPLLIVTQDDGTEAVLFESAVICEYLEESQPGVPLHPADPDARTASRLDRVRLVHPVRSLGLRDSDPTVLARSQFRDYYCQPCQSWPGGP